MSRVTFVGSCAWLAMSIPTPQSAGAVVPAGNSSASACESLTPFSSRVMPTLDQRIASIRKQHAKLRDLLNVPLPEADTVILVMMSSGHHSFTDLSYVATRDKKGHWTVDRVGRTRSEFVEVPPIVEPVSRRSLTNAEGRALDDLLRNECLYLQPPVVAYAGVPPLGGWQTSIAVITPRHRYTGNAFGPIPSIGGKVVTAVTGW